MSRDFPHHNMTSAPVFFANFRGVSCVAGYSLGGHPRTCKWLITHGDRFRPLSRVVSLPNSLNNL